MTRLGRGRGREAPRPRGFVHSIAFANYSDGWKPFHETRKDDFRRQPGSAFSLVALASAPPGARAGRLRGGDLDLLDDDRENYGYMAPIKAALDSAIVFLAKSFSAENEVRFNGVQRASSRRAPRRDPRLRRFVAARREGHVPGPRSRHRGGRLDRSVPALPALQRDQRAGRRGRHGMSSNYDARLM